MNRIARGFTLIEMMVVIAIVGILTAIAVPAYSAYILRARTAEAFTTLGGLQPVAEQFWANNRTYEGFAAPADTANFKYEMTSASASAYVAKATGKQRMVGFTYTINQRGDRATTSVPTGWTTNDSCWVDRKGGLCTQ